MRMAWYGCGLVLALSMVGCDNDFRPPGGSGGGNTVSSNGLPCEVKEVVERNCGSCHSDPPQYGAPMALASGSDLNTHAAQVLRRVNAGTMPPASQPPMSASDKAVLTRWLNAGAGPVNERCAAGGGSSGGGGGAYEASDAECDYVFEMRAHGGQTPNDRTPYSAPKGLSPDHYELFYFTPPWTEEVHTIRVDSIQDNKTVLHHWLLYQEPRNGRGNGTHVGNIGLHMGDSQLLTGWAPGNDGLKLKSDVGVQTIRGPNARFALEIHYNTSGAGLGSTADRSGARVCATRKLRPKVAAVHWLGTQAILGTSATGDCSPRAESHILSYSPHMHTKGRHMKTVIRRRNGTQEVLTDKPFAFDDQAQYRVDNPAGEVVVGPGDRLTTTCTYSQLAVFGPGTDQEMCYNFVLAWPAGSLTSSVAGLGSVVGGANTCIDVF